MTAQRREDGTTDRQQRATMQRRGILAAAGAVVAGIVAKQAALPVSAATSSLQYPSSGTTVATNTATARTDLTGSFDDPIFQVTNSGTTTGAFGIAAFSSGNAALTASINSTSTVANAPAILAQQLSSASGGVGVTAKVGGSGNSTIALNALNLSSGTGGTGVLGQSDTGTGVIGTVTNTSPTASTIAVSGVNSNTGGGAIGVFGQSDIVTGIGVKGSSLAGTGILGTIPSGASANNTVAVHATNFSTGNNAVTVEASNNSGGTGAIAVKATTGNVAGTIAVSGVAGSGAGSIGVLGQCDSSTGTGVKGSSTSGIGVFGTIPSGANGTAVAVSGLNASTGSGATSVLGTIAGGAGVNTIGVSGINNATGSGGVGVFGQCDNGGLTGVGVKGSSTSGRGVHGIIPSGSASTTIAVLGENFSTGTFARGVVGTTSASGSIGVLGQCNAASGTGVQGATTNPSGTGVYGLASAAAAGDGSGVYGFVHHVGQTQVTAGVFGDSDASYGIIGRTTAVNYSGCTGIATKPNTAAFAGAGTGGATCAYFTGATIVQGDFTVVSGQKNAAVKHADGSYRLLHCVESPEPWFEDFGEAKLVNGRADVKLDADFAAVVDTSSYLVFLTERDAHNDLYVTKQTASGFAVQAKTGTPSGGFYYRIVAKRKDIKVGRLAKFELPKIKLPTPEELPK